MLLYHLIHNLLDFKLDNTDIQTIERFSFLDFLLLFKGQFTRSELVERFGIGEATASRAIKSYLKKHSNQANYLGPRLGYVTSDTFIPKFKHLTDDGLNYVATGELISKFNISNFGISIHSINKSLSLDVIAPVTRAIVRCSYVNIDYVSTTSGISSRVIAPHSLFRACGTWYFRAYDLQTSSFRTFKFSRLKQTVNLGGVEKDTHNKAKDDAWNQQRLIKLKAHPKLQHAAAIELDLELESNKTKELIMSEVTVGFAMSELRVDCSKKHKLNPKEFPLVLINREELESVESMIIAPGYSYSENM